MLQKKSEYPEEPKGSYFGRLLEFFDITAQSDGAYFNNWLHTSWFDVKFFKKKTIFPFLSSLSDEIEEAFSILEPLKDITLIDPASFLNEAKDLNNFSVERSISLADFCDQKLKLNSAVIPSLVN